MSKSFNELEMLLSRDSFFNNNTNNDTKTSNKKSNQNPNQQNYYTKDIQKAKGNASLIDFIDMVALIVESTMDDLHVAFMTDEKAYLYKDDPVEPINHPIVTFKILQREHTDKSSYKPKLMEEVINEQDGRPGYIYNERFTSHVQFNIIAPEYRIAWEVMERLEEILISYAETIRGNGIVEYFFLKQHTDAYYDSFRNTFTVLNLVYRVDTESLRVIFKENIKDIVTNHIKK